MFEVLAYSMNTPIDNVEMTAFYLDELLVEPSINRVSRAGKTHKLAPKLMDLLCCFAQHPLKMLSREQLLSIVWDREYVNDEVLSRSIGQLRQIIGDDARQPVYIETIPRKGYRLIVNPESVTKKPMSTTRSWFWFAIAGGVVAGAIWQVSQIWTVGSVVPNDTIYYEDPTRLASRFTSSPGIERAASISDDGHQAVYLRDSDTGSKIYIADLQSNTPHRLLLDSESYKNAPTFSPDRASVAFIDRTQQACEVKTINVMTAEQQTLAACWNNYLSDLDWSHDGQSLAYTYDAPIGAGLALFNMTTQTVDILTYPENPAHADVRPRFSPDSRRIAFTRGGQITRELYLLDLDTTHGATQLTRDEQLVTGHDWLANNQLIYASDKQANQALWQLQLDDLQVSYLGARGARNPVYDASNNLLMYEQWRYQANIWSLDLQQATEPKPIIISNRYDNQPSFSPDDRYLAFCSNRTGSDSLWLANADGSEQRRIYSLMDARVSRPAWSVDGDRLMVTVYTETGSYLHELSPTGEKLREILWAGNNVSDAVYHSDGQRLLYIRHTDESSELWQTDIGLNIEEQSGGSASRVGAVQANRVQVGTTGEVFFTRPAVDGIFSIDLNSLQIKSVVDMLPSHAWNQWVVGSDSLFYVADGAIWRMPLSTHEHFRVSEFLPNAIGITMAVARNGNQLLVTRTDAAEIDLMLSRLQVQNTP